MKNEEQSCRLTLKGGVTPLWIIRIQATKELSRLIDDFSPICDEFRHGYSPMCIAVRCKSDGAGFCGTVAVSDTIKIYSAIFYKDGTSTTFAVSTSNEDSKMGPHVSVKFILGWSYCASKFWVAERLHGDDIHRSERRMVVQDTAAQRKSEAAEIGDPREVAEQTESNSEHGSNLGCWVYHR